MTSFPNSHSLLAFLTARGKAAKNIFFNLSTKKWEGLRIEEKSEYFKDKIKVCAKTNVKIYRSWEEYITVTEMENWGCLIDDLFGKIKWNGTILADCF